MGRIRVNDPIRPRELTTIQGERITIPEPEFRTHLQFRRFADRKKRSGGGAIGSMVGHRRKPTNGSSAPAASRRNRERDRAVCDKR
jgi:hypothetical protein